MAEIVTPDWIRDAVFYQIFPDRFAPSARTKYPRGLVFKPWGSPPEEQGYQGGSLYGVLEKLGYLKDLGINAIYFNPIFSSASNHRYHTFDYYEVDPLLGGNDALRVLIDEAHSIGIKIVLDGVFNHASRGFWQFHHILENGGDSPYIDWFRIHGWPLSPYSRDPVNDPANYAAWEGLLALPQFNHSNPGVRDFLFDVAKYWIDFGIDGWRLDVPAEIDDDTFWQEFRRVVKTANPDAYIVGEIWSEAKRWLQGDQFDAVMNYTFAWSSMSFFGAKTLADYPRDNYQLTPRDAAGFADVIADMHSRYAWEINHVQLNLLDSHDTARALWVVGEDKSALKLCALFQMTMPGAPCIYYGDEIGMSGADDPYCRAAFPWHQPETWDNDLLAHYKKAITLRHAHPVLRRGDYTTVYAEGDVLAFRRTFQGVTALVCFNAGSESQTVSIPGMGGTYEDAWGQSGRISGEGTLDVTIPARDAVILVTAGEIEKD